jgi:HK97 gp10 family phage protein
MARVEFEFTISGVKEVNAVLRQLPSRIQRRILGGAMRAAARVVREAARNNAPKDTGHLAKNIVVRTVPKRRTLSPTAVRVIVWPKAVQYPIRKSKYTPDASNIGYWHEYGTYQSFINAPYPRKYVQPPRHKVDRKGVKARGWLTRAGEETRSQVISVFRSKLIRDFNKFALKGFPTRKPRRA